MKRSKKQPELRLAIVFVGLAALTLLAYSSLLSSPTGLLWDDEGHITAPSLRSFDGLRRIWLDVGATQQYYPLVHSAFWLQARLWGDNLTGYHLVNILLHAASATLLVGILRRLAVPGALLAGLLFALHPVQVESVAWVSELKNTLSCVFFLAAAHTFLKFDDSRRRGAYVSALGLFLCALLTKSVTATLPAGLLVVLWFRRGGLEWTRDVLPLMPFLALAIAGGVFTVWFERTAIGAEGEAFAFGFVERVLIAGRALWFYAAKLVWPVPLSFNYARWVVNPAAWWQYLFPLAVAMVLLALWQRRLWGTLTAVLVFCLTVAPALGFVNVYPFRYSFVADHFQYHASIGLLALVAAGLTTLVGRLGGSRRAVLAAGAAVSVSLGVMTRQQAANYVDAPTLYRATIAANPGSWLAHSNLAALLLSGPPSDVRLAAEHARKAVELNPEYLEGRFNLGVALENLDQFDAAIAEYRYVLRWAESRAVPRRRVAATHHRLGATLNLAGRPADAISELERAAELMPGSAAVHFELALAYAGAGRPRDGLPHFQRAVALEPTSARYQTNLGSAFLQLGRSSDAIEALSAAVRLDSSMSDAFFNLGSAYATVGRYPEAVAAYREAVRLRPGDARAQAALRAVLVRIPK